MDRIIRTISITVLVIILLSCQEAAEKSNTRNFFVKYTDSQGNIFCTDTIILIYGEATEEDFSTSYNDCIPQAIDFYRTGCGMDSLLIQQVNYKKNIFRTDTVYIRRNK